MFPNISHILYDLGNTLLYFDGDWEDVFRQAVEAAGRAGDPFGLGAGRQAAFAGSLATRLRANYARRAGDLVEQPARDIFRAALSEAGVGTDAAGTAGDAGAETGSPADGMVGSSAAEAGVTTPAVDDGLLDAAIRAFYAVTEAHWTAVPEVERTLAALRGAGLRQAVLSNAADDEDVQALVDKAGLRPHLDFVLSSAAIGRRKPDPRAFRSALDRWGVAPSAVLMVGDNPAADIRGAQQAGMAAVWVRKYAVEKLGEIRPDAEIGTVVELLGIL